MEDRVLNDDIAGDRGNKLGLRMRMSVDEIRDVLSRR